MIRSGYSFKRAYGHLEDVLSRIQECGLPAAPLADTSATFGFTRWTKLCKKAVIKPVYGVELAVTPNYGDKKPVVDYWTFIAKNSLVPLHKLIEIATDNPGKEPILNYQEALAAEGVYKIAGHAARLDHMEPQNSLSVGLSPAVNKGFFKQASEAGYSFIARSDNFYPREEDKEAYRIALGRRSNTQTYPQWILTDDEWHNALDWVPQYERQEAIDWRNELLGEVSAELIKGENLKPERKESLREICCAGAARLGCNLSDPVYAARLERELKLIEDKGFDDYIYIIADMVNWAKQRMIVGPARGSSCGSLVCYLTGITTVDPIPYNLLFERFIDINRNDPPDIDIDFSDSRRDMVFEYAEKKYGRDHVARLGTVHFFRTKSALNAIGPALGIPQWELDKVADAAPIRSEGDSGYEDTLKDAFETTEAGQKLIKNFPEAVIASKLEGHPTNHSQHAAGVIITAKPIIEYIGINAKSPRSVMCDKKDAEEQNLLKIDALGLTQLSIFERCLQLIGQKDRSGWLETLPLDCPEAFDVLNSGRFSGIFQFDGAALKGLTKQVKVSHLEDLIALTSLARPGPLDSGGAEAWVKRKNGEQEISYYHPAFEPVLKDTLGIIIYQEQVMRIGREVGDMAWEDVIALRKAIGKKLGGEVLNSFKEKFAVGAKKKGIPDYIIDVVWNDVCTFGTYGFNRSHAVAYSIVSYYCMWLKAHYPVEFGAATLDAEKDPQKQIKILRELKAEGVDYIPVDPEASGARWEIKEENGRKVLVGPLTQIKGIGPAKVQEIINSRATGKELGKALKLMLEKAKTEIDTLYPIETAINRLHPDIETSAGIVTSPTKISDVKPGETVGNVVIMGVVKRINQKNENAPEAVKRRGYEMKGPTTALNLFVADDHDEILVKIDRFKFEEKGRDILDRGRAGAALYAFKGYCPPGFRMISVVNAKYLGDMEDDNANGNT